MANLAWRQHAKLAFLGAALLAVLAFVVVKVILPRFDSEERKIARVVDQAVAAGRERRVGNLLALADPSYSDAVLSNKEELAAVLTRMYFIYKRVSVEVEGTPVVTWSADRPDEGEATLTARILLGRSLEEEPTDNSVGRARGTDFWRLTFRKDPESGEWRITSTAAK